MALRVAGALLGLLLAASLPLLSITVFEAAGCACYWYCNTGLAVNTVHMFMSTCSHVHCSQVLFFGAAPFLAYEEVFPRRVHSVFISEQYLRTVNVNKCS